jgi:outer membrane protein assembly factor BamA
MTRSFGIALLAFCAAPGSFADAEPEKEGSLSIVPFAVPAYQPETSWVLGGAASLVHQPPEETQRKESEITLSLAASVRGQFTVLLQPDWYVAGDALQLNGTFSAARFPDSFYGIGNDTRSDAEEDYTPIYYEVDLSPRLRVARSIYLGPSLRFQRTRIIERQAGGLLDQGGITGSRGGTTVQLGISAAWDTRDSTLYPRRGDAVRLSLRSARRGFGSSFSFDTMRLDARGYRTLPWLRHIVAVQALLELRDGEPPFYDTGLLGGEEMMRGDFEGRYRDRQLAAAQVEYRAPLFWRVGVVGFASAGNVARDPGGLADGVKLAGGGGIRVAPLADVPVNVRFDVAYGTDVQFYLNLGEAF